MIPMKMYEKYYIVSAYVKFLFPISFIGVMKFYFFESFDCGIKAL